MVDLAPGADQDPLALKLADLVQRGVERPEQRREFERLRGSVGVVVDDAGTALTLRFDYGRLTVHEGLVGVPTVTLRGSAEDIEALADLPFSSPLGVLVPNLASAQGRRRARDVLGALGGRRVKIYGLISHPRLVLRLLRVLSRSG